LIVGFVLYPLHCEGTFAGSGKPLLRREMLCAIPPYPVF